MISLTSLDGRSFFLNAEMIVSFAATPETVVSLLGRRQLVVRESVGELREKISAYQQILRHPQFLEPLSQSTAEPLPALQEDTP